MLNDKSSEQYSKEEILDAVAAFVVIAVSVSAVVFYLSNMSY